MKNLLIIMLFMITLMGCGETDEVTPETLVEQGVVTEDAIVKPFYGAIVQCKKIGETSSILTNLGFGGVEANVFKLILQNNDTLSFHGYGSYSLSTDWLKGQVIIYKTEIDSKFNKFILYLEADDYKDLSKRKLYKYQYKISEFIKH